MQANQIPATETRDKTFDYELAGILFAVSIVSKRLAEKLTNVKSALEEGGEEDA